MRRPCLFSLLVVSTHPHEVLEVGAGEEAVHVVDDVATVHDLPEDVLVCVMDRCVRHLVERGRRRTGR